MNLVHWKKFIIGTSDHGTVFLDTEKSYKNILRIIGRVKMVYVNER